ASRTISERYFLSRPGLTSNCERTRQVWSSKRRPLFSRSKAATSARKRAALRIWLDDAISGGGGPCSLRPGGKIKSGRSVVRSRPQLCRVGASLGRLNRLSIVQDSPGARYFLSAGML